MYCRVRPILDMERRKAGPGQDVDVTSFPAEDEIVVKQDDTGMLAKRFEFDRVFTPASTQVEVYNEVHPLVISAMDGYNVCIFAYGQVRSVRPVCRMIRMV